MDLLACLNGRAVQAQLSSSRPHDPQNYGLRCQFGSLANLQDVSDTIPTCLPRYLGFASPEFSWS